MGGRTESFRIKDRKVGEYIGKDLQKLFSVYYNRKLGFQLKFKDERETDQGFRSKKV